ncbi:MAG TPA: ABC transporter ATP-binding protein [Ruminococcaceae bacterium]|jgi:ABC-2 type transport system ATP-binding protein|nr:ABC transporter ATP-binding protein [Oscillospiraceae bacterium]
MSETLLKVRDLKKSYGDHAVLKGVSYDIEQGKIVGLLGPNGCGKTSMIKSIVGLINDYEGKILINGKAPGVESKKIIAYLPEKNYLPNWMTPKSAIKYMADFYDNFDMQKALDMAARFELPMKQKIKTMSKGQQEKLQLLLVMSRKADLYILDEPLGGVDLVSREFILDTIMKNHAENSTILLSTHLIYDIEKVLDRVLMVKDGKLLVNTDVSKITADGKTVEDLFREVFSYVG